MPKIDTHPDGLPCWNDVMVETTDQRKKLMAFYTTLYGWTWDEGDESTGYYSIASSDGSAVMGCGQGPGGAGALVPYFKTSDIDASVAKATEFGGTVFMGPMQVMTVGKMALVNDPTGATHGLWEPLDFHGFGVQYEPNAPGWDDHASHDPDAAGTYYAQLLGHTLMEPEPGMKILAAGEQWFASFSHDPDGGPPRWSPIYVVDTLARARDTVTAAGGTVVLEEQPVPGSAISVFLDPVMGKPNTVMGAGQQP
jgi:uncharacterized protein